MVMGETDQLAVDAERSVKIVNGGILYMNDTFTLSAPDDSEVTFSDFWIGMPSYFTPERSTFEVYESGEWHQVQVSRQSFLGVVGSRIEFVVPVTLSAGSSMTLRASYLSINTVGATTEVYFARLPVYTLIEHNISQYHLELEFPPGAEFDSISSVVNMTEVEVDDHWSVTYSREDIPALALVEAIYYYTPSAEDGLMLSVESASRSVTVKSNKLLIEDSYAITNRGPIIFEVPLDLPLDAGNIKARDGVGSIDTTVSESDDSKEVKVAPRSPIIPGTRWVFTVSYSTEIGDHVTSTGGASQMSYPNIELPHFIRGIEATITRPESETVQLTYGPTLPSERSVIEADVPPGSIMPTLRPVAIIAAVLLVIVGATLLKRRERPASVVTAVEVEAPILNEFIEKQQERVRLLKELDSLEDDLQEGTIDNEQYDRMAAVNNRELSSLSDSLRQLGRDLSEEPELAEPLREIRQAEGELTRIASDLKNLEVRLRARRVSRSDYERRRKERIRRRGLAIKRIEKALESLGG